MRLALSLIFYLVLSKAEAALVLPPHWGELKALPPNVASYVYMNSVPEKESSVTLQIHPVVDKVRVLRDQIKANKLPPKFGALKLLRQEKFGDGCTRLTLEHTKKKSFFERQTWCFGPAKAWVVIERGSWRIGDGFIRDLLKQHEWRAK